MNDKNPQQEWIPSQAEWMAAQGEIDQYLQRKKKKRLTFWSLIFAIFFGLIFGFEYLFNEDKVVVPGCEEEPAQVPYPSAREAMAAVQDHNKERSNHLAGDQEDGFGAQDGWGNPIPVIEHVTEVVPKPMVGIFPTSSFIHSNGDQLPNPVRDNASGLVGILNPIETDRDQKSFDPIILKEGEALSKESRTEDAWVTDPLPTSMGSVIALSGQIPVGRIGVDKTKHPSWSWGSVLELSLNTYQWGREGTTVRPGFELMTGISAFYRRIWRMSAVFGLRPVAPDYGVTRVVYQDHASLGAHYDRWSITPKVVLPLAFRCGIGRRLGDFREIFVWTQASYIIGTWSRIEKDSFRELSLIQTGQSGDAEDLGIQWVRNANLKAWTWQVGLDYQQRLWKNIDGVVGVEYNFQSSDYWLEEMQSVESRMINPEKLSPIGIRLGLKWTL